MLITRHPARTAASGPGLWIYLCHCCPAAGDVHRGTRTRPGRAGTGRPTRAAAAASACAPAVAARPGSRLSLQRLLDNGRLVAVARQRGARHNPVWTEVDQAESAEAVEGH